MYRVIVTLAAAAAFAAVYWLTPAPAYVAMPAPGPVAQALPAVSGAERASAAAAPARAIVKPGSNHTVSPPRPIAGAERRAFADPVRSEPTDPVYFPGCNAVRAAGLAPLYRGQPGYRPEMDGDDDGIACEPYRGL